MGFVGGTSVEFYKSKIFPDFRLRWDAPAPSWTMLFSSPPSRQPPDFKGLPQITLRQLEVFRMVCRERSYAHAALELHSTRANIKRVCADFESAVGRSIFEEAEDKMLMPTAFATGLLAQVGPLAQALRRMAAGIQGVHDSGRIVRFAAAGEFFRGGLFTDFLGRLEIADVFRPCYLRLGVKRFQTALLNAECDVYFGAGIKKSDRLDQVDLGSVPWRIVVRGSLGTPHKTSDLPKGQWWVAGTGEPELAEMLLQEFHAAGAAGGGVFDPNGVEPDTGVLFYPDPSACDEILGREVWPRYRFTASLRKNHPYAELQRRLAEGAIR